MEPVDFDLLPTAKPAEKPWATNGHKNNREHNIVNSLYLKPEELEAKNFERFERYEIIKQNEQKAEEYMLEDAEIVIAAVGLSARVAKSAINQARAEGIKVGLIRPITLFPFPVDYFDKIKNNPNVKEILTVEMNMGQMIDDVKLATKCRGEYVLCNRVGGMIPSPEEVLEVIEKANKNGGAK